MNQIQKNIPLAQYTTFKIGGPAKYFFVARATDDLIKAVEFAKNKQLPYFILGGGSNLLVSDKGFNGLVILMNNEGRTVSNNIIFAEAGTRLSDLVKISVDCLVWNGQLEFLEPRWVERFEVMLGLLVLIFLI
jgi:UDP-N-acetylmuramate dehydrogenase